MDLDELSGCGIVPCDPLDRATSPERIVDFGQPIRFRKQPLDLLWRRLRLDPCRVGDRPGRKSHAIELRRCRDLTTADFDAEAMGLPVQVIAITRSEGGHQELATIHRTSVLASLARDEQGLISAGGGYVHRMFIRCISNAGRNFHAWASFPGAVWRVSRSGGEAA